MKQHCLRCLLLLGALCITGVTVILTALVQEWTHEKLGIVLEMAVVLGIVGIILVVSDLTTLGPSIALHHSTVALATAMLVAVPLGLVLFAVIEWDAVVGIAVLCLTAFGAMAYAFGFIGCCLGLAATCGIVVLSGAMEGGSTVDQTVAARLSICGVTLVLISIYRPTRKAITLRRIEDWADMVEVDARSEEFRERAKFFRESCELRADKYPFRLGVVAIYRTKGQNWATKKGHEFGLLFHGTSWEGAKGIIARGFKLPEHPGMFGKGIYFADSPLKSWQYASHEEAIPKPCCPALPCCNRGGLILMCLVDMGEKRQESAANVQLTGYDRTGCWACLTCGTGAYDSVVGLSQEEGGALRVPEYVVYNTRQARVDYVFEVSLEKG